MKSLIKVGKQVTLEKETWILGKRYLITLEWLFGNTDEFQDKTETTVIETTVVCLDVQMCY